MFLTYPFWCGTQEFAFLTISQMMLVWGPHSENHCRKALEKRFLSLFYIVCMSWPSFWRNRAWDKKLHANTLLGYAVPGKLVWGEERNTKEERRANRREDVCYLLMSWPSLCNNLSLLPGEIKGKKFIYQLSLVSHLQFITATPGDVPPTSGQISFLFRSPLEKTASVGIRLPQGRRARGLHA